MIYDKRASYLSRVGTPLHSEASSPFLSYTFPARHNDTDSFSFFLLISRGLPALSHFLFHFCPPSITLTSITPYTLIVKTKHQFPIGKF